MAEHQQYNFAGSLAGVALAGIGFSEPETCFATWLIHAEHAEDAKEAGRYNIVLDLRIAEGPQAGQDVRKWLRIPLTLMGQQGIAAYGQLSPEDKKTEDNLMKQWVRALAAIGMTPEHMQQLTIAPGLFLNKRVFGHWRKTNPQIPKDKGQYTFLSQQEYTDGMSGKLNQLNEARQTGGAGAPGMPGLGGGMPGGAPGMGGPNVVGNAPGPQGASGFGPQGGFGAGGPQGGPQGGFGGPGVGPQGGFGGPGVGGPGVGGPGVGAPQGGNAFTRMVGQS